MSIFLCLVSTLECIHLPYAYFMAKLSVTQVCQRLIYMYEQLSHFLVFDFWNVVLGVLAMRYTHSPVSKQAKGPQGCSARTRFCPNYYANSNLISSI